VKHYTNKARQAGMTLIELTVVLLVLIGLAGLMIPYVGSFVEKTGDTTSANNMTQLNNAMMRFTVEKNRLPHHMQALVNRAAATGAATGVCAGAAVSADGDSEGYCGLNNPTLFGVVEYTSAANSIEIDSLTKSGLEMSVQSNADAVSKTFDSNSGMFYLPGTNGGTMESGLFSTVLASPDFSGMNTFNQTLAYALGGAGMDYEADCYDYLAFGIGDNIELNGNTMTSTPVAFPKDATYGPEQNYAHFIGIIQVDKANTGTDTVSGNDCSSVTEKAKFLGVVMDVHGNTKLTGAGQAAGAYYSNQAAAGN